MGAKKGGGKVWVSSRYEKLSDFCFACGKLGRVMKGCGEEMQMEEANSLKMRYGPMMREVPIRTRGGMERRDNREE